MDMTIEEDTQIRNFAKRLDWDYGEDAYQEAVVHALRCNVVVIDPIGFFKFSSRRLLNSLYNKERAESRAIQYFLEDFIPPNLANLRAGREKLQAMGGGPVKQKQTHCVKGHPMGIGDPNVMTSGDKRRRCRSCFLTSQKARRDRKKGAAYDSLSDVQLRG